MTVQPHEIPIHQHPYGFCRQCGGLGVKREVVDGVSMDTCMGRHRYPSHEASRRGFSIVQLMEMQAKATP